MVSRHEFKNLEDFEKRMLETLLRHELDNDSEIFGIFTEDHIFLNHYVCSTSGGYLFHDETENKLISHTHPHNDSFTDMDLKLACEGKVLEIRAITIDTIYSLKAPDGWPAWSLLNDFIFSSDRDWYNLEIEYLYKPMPDDIRKTFTDNRAEQVAEQFNLIYKRIPVGFCCVVGT